MNTVHTAQILQSPPDHAIFHERGQPLSVAALSHSQATGWCCGGNTADCRLFGWQDISSSGLATKTLIFFYLGTNNAIKWQINQTTVNTNVHFTVDAIMYMYVNNLTGRDARYTMCEVEMITCTPNLASYMGPKRVVMKFDNLLCVIVRRCEQHAYYKLTNKRPTDTSFIDKK